MQAQTTAVHDAVTTANTGGEALRAVIQETVRAFGTQLDDFRLAFLQSQVVKPGSVRFTPEQFARLRPLNDRLYGGTAKLLADDRKRRRGRADVDPRVMAILARAAALGILTMKGLVESMGEPLLPSDEALVKSLARIFEAAADE